MDAQECLFLLCTKHVYLLDGFQVTSEENDGHFMRLNRHALTEQVIEVEGDDTDDRKYHLQR